MKGIDGADQFPGPLAAGSAACCGRQLSFPVSSSSIPDGTGEHGARAAWLEIDPSGAQLVRVPVPVLRRHATGAARGRRLRPGVGA
jgi:hypothetical protein